MRQNYIFSRKNYVHLPQLLHLTAREMTRRPIFLIGFMAAGKTSLGRFAAKRMGYEFIDLDRYIEARFRKSISEIFAEMGEEAFRIIERNMLHEVADFEGVLVATGGGTPCFFDNIKYMNERGVTIFLSCSVDVICHRLQVAKIKRPLVEGCTPEELQQRVTRMLQERLPYYTPAQHTFPADEYDKATALALATEQLQEIIKE